MVEPDYAPYEKEISGLHEMQEVVGGSIQAIYPYKEQVAIVCNEEGILNDLPFNRSIEGGYGGVFGTFFVCGLTSNDFTDLTPQQMKRYEELYHDPQLFFLLGKTLCVEHTTPEEYSRVMTPPSNTKESPER